MEHGVGISEEMGMLLWFKMLVAQKREETTRKKVVLWEGLNSDEYNKAGNYTK